MVPYILYRAHNASPKNVQTDEMTPPTQITSW